MAKVGAISTHDEKPKPDVTVPDPKKEPDGNTPINRQETQEEHDARRPIDQA
jgi:hypothetical protein